MRDDVILQLRISLAAPIPRMIPEITAFTVANIGRTQLQQG